MRHYKTCCLVRTLNRTRRDGVEMNFLTEIKKVFRKQNVRVLSVSGDHEGVLENFIRVKEDELVELWKVRKRRYPLKGV